MFINDIQYNLKHIASAGIIEEMKTLREKKLSIKGTGIDIEKVCRIHTHEIERFVYLKVKPTNITVVKY